MITQHQAKMIGFARATLQILERDKDWDADTLDDIGEAARKAELSSINKYHEFVIIPVGDCALLANQAE